MTSYIQTYIAYDPECRNWYSEDGGGCDHDTKLLTTTGTEEGDDVRL